jgi:SSS family solute:Na+ symporter
LSIPIALLLKYLPIEALKPWMHQMGLTAVLTMFVIISISYLQNKGTDDEKGIPLSKELFKTSPLFNIGSIVICIITATLYCLFW